MQRPERSVVKGDSLNCKVLHILQVCGAGTEFLYAQRAFVKVAVKTRVVIGVPALAVNSPFSAYCKIFFMTCINKAAVLYAVHGIILIRLF